MTQFVSAEGNSVVRHREGQRGLAHKDHSLAQIGGHTCGSFTTLFSANAADYQSVDITLAQPAVEPGVREGIMDVFLENHIRLMT